MLSASGICQVAQQCRAVQIALAADALRLDASACVRDFGPENAACPGLKAFAWVIPSPGAFDTQQSIMRHFENGVFVGRVQSWRAVRRADEQVQEALFS